MNTLNQTYKALSIPYFREVFECIDKIMTQHGIRYYLIGSTAMALEHLKRGIKPIRGTKDIDFAIMISSMEMYEQISNSLVTKGFNKVNAPWTFYSPQYKVAIDILPFGEIEEKEFVQFKNRHIDLHILGFTEILDKAVPIEIEDKIANIPSLTGMVLLKLIAWDDRPEERTDDLADILTIIEHYFEINTDEIIEFHYDTFPEKEEIDTFKVAAEVIGRKSYEFLKESKTLSFRINKILDINTKSKSESKIARTWAWQKGWEIEYTYTVLEAFQKGLLHQY